MKSAVFRSRRVSVWGFWIGLATLLSTPALALLNSAPRQLTSRSETAAYYESHFGWQFGNSAPEIRFNRQPCVYRTGGTSALFCGSRCSTERLSRCYHIVRGAGGGEVTPGEFQQWIEEDSPEAQRRAARAERRREAARRVGGGTADEAAEGIGARMGDALAPLGVPPTGGASGDGAGDAPDAGLDGLASEAGDDLPPEAQAQSTAPELARAPAPQSEGSTQPQGQTAATAPAAGGATTPPAAGGTTPPAEGGGAATGAVSGSSSGTTTAAASAQTPAPAGTDSERPVSAADRDATDSEARRAQESTDRNAQENSDECRYSAQLNGNYACSPTKALIQGAQITNQLTQAAGSMVTQVVGQQSQQQAMQSGRQSTAMEAAGTLQQTTGGIQMGTGAANAVLGMAQFLEAQKHGDLSGQVRRNLKTSREAFVTDQNGRVRQATTAGLTQQALTQFDLQGQHVGAVTTQMARIQSRVANEQTRMSREAMAGGLASTLIGVTQMTTGALQVAAGDQMKQAAAQLRNAEETARSVNGVLPGLNQMPTGDTMAPRGGSTIVGNGVDPDTSAATGDEDDSLEPPASLGTPFNPNPLGNAPEAGPPPGRFVANEGGGARAGAGPGGAAAAGGGGGQSAAAQAAEDPQAKYAESMRNGNAYGTAGAAPMAGGGPGAGAPGNGPDLSGLLAQFLPKSQEDLGPKNGILDFGGSRDPAGEAPVSLLDRGANIFNRIHQTYQEKNRRGSIGI